MVTSDCARIAIEVEDGYVTVIKTYYRQVEEAIGIVCGFIDMGCSWKINWHSTTICSAVCSVLQA